MLNTRALRDDGLKMVPAGDWALAPLQNLQPGLPSGGHAASVGTGAVGPGTDPGGCAASGPGTGAR